jgi:hypothetical protein
MANVASAQFASNAAASRLSASASQAGRAGAFFLALLLQILGLGLGAAGTALSILRPNLPSIVALALISLGLTMLCASSARVTYRYGFMHLLPTFLVSLTAGVALVTIMGPFFVARLSTPITPRLVTALANHFSWMPSLAFLGAWLAVAAIMPPLLALGGCIAGIGARKRIG